MNNPNNKSSLNREDLGGSPYGSSNILIRITGRGYSLYIVAGYSNPGG